MKTQRKDGSRDGVQAHVSAGPPAVRRRIPRQERARVTVDAIIEATVELADTDGWTHLSTNRIAERAGVSIGSLYQYFPNKESILAAVVEKHYLEVHRIVWQALEEMADPATPLARVLASMFRRLVQIHVEDPALTRVAMVAEQQARSDPEESGVFAAALEEIFRRRPDTAMPHPMVAAHVTTVCAQALTRWLAHEAPEGLDREVAIDEMTAMLTGYLVSGKSADGNP